MTYVLLLIDNDKEAPYFVDAGNADTSLAVVGTTMFIVLFCDAFAVNVSRSVPFLCIFKVASLTVGIVGVFAISL